MTSELFGCLELLGVWKYRRVSDVQKDFGFSFNAAPTIDIVIESGEVTYTSQYRIHTENTSISYHQDPKQKIETHIPGVGRHTRYPWDSGDHTVRPRPKDQWTYPKSPGITNTLDNDGHLRLRTFRTNTTAYRTTEHSLHNHITHSLPFLSLFRYTPSFPKQPHFLLSHAVLSCINR